MSADVQFEEEVVPVHEVPVARESILTRLILKTKLAKNPKSAQMVLLGVAVLSFVGATLMVLDLGSKSQYPTPVPNANWPPSNVPGATITS